MAKGKSDYYTVMVSNNSESPRQLWNCINQILHRWPAPSLPYHVSIKFLCDSSSSHFKDKISLIRLAITGHTLSTVNVDSQRVISLHRLNLPQLMK